MPFRKTNLAVGVVLAALSIVALGQDSDPRADLQKNLINTFTLTKTTADRSDIVTPGAVVVLQKDDLLMYATSSPLPPVNTFRNGKISQGWGGFGRDMGITMLSGGNATANDYPKQKAVTGQKFWVTGITVNKDNISVILYSDPDANNLRYYGQLNFPMGKGGVPAADVALKEIEQALTVQPADNSSAGAQSAPASGAAQPMAPIAAPPAPASAASQPAMAPIAPPPPPSDAAAPPPKTVSLGQTRDQVTAVLGQPQKVVKLGAKEIDYYPDMKVIFMNGKVSDVQ
ncbi:MAG TPA: hypothetical protein VMD92_18105 [Acidobacteriaceae bacterium]|jgi:hypothetical protein|nr:hypothetical protein [Acidobacteriaceae bacterium]